MKRFSLLTVLFCFGIGACERHELDGPNGTGQLHQHHHAADGAHDEHAGDKESH